MYKQLEKVTNEAILFQMDKKKNRKQISEKEKSWCEAAKEQIMRNVINEIEENLMDKCMAKAEARVKKRVRKEMAKQQVEEANKLIQVGVCLAFAVGFSVNQLTEIVDPLKRYCADMPWILFVGSGLFIVYMVVSVLKQSINEYMKVDGEDV